MVRRRDAGSEIAGEKSCDDQQGRPFHDLSHLHPLDLGLDPEQPPNPHLKVLASPLERSPRGDSSYDTRVMTDHLHQLGIDLGAIVPNETVGDRLHLRCKPLEATGENLLLKTAQDRQESITIEHRNQVAGRPNPIVREP